MENLVASLLAPRQQQQQQCPIAHQQSQVATPAPAFAPPLQHSQPQLPQQFTQQEQLLLPLIQQTLANQLRQQQEQEHPASTKFVGRQEAAQGQAQPTCATTQPVQVHPQRPAQPQTQIPVASSQPQPDPQQIVRILSLLQNNNAPTAAAPASSVHPFLAQQAAAAPAARASVAPPPLLSPQHLMADLLQNIMACGSLANSNEIGTLVVQLGSLLQQRQQPPPPLPSQSNLASNPGATLLAPAPAVTGFPLFDPSSLLSSQVVLAPSQQVPRQLQQLPQRQHQHISALVGAPTAPCVNMGSNNSNYLAMTHAMDVVTNPGQHDVLLGRGSGASNHLGNIRYRMLIEKHKPRYTAASRVDKPKVADEIVHIWRNLNPPGRFLIRCDKEEELEDDEDYTTGRWNDVGDSRAKTKTCQCLREKERPPRKPRKKGDDAAKRSGK